MKRNLQIKTVNPTTPTVLSSQNSGRTLEETMKSVRAAEEQQNTQNYMLKLQHLINQKPMNAAYIGLSLERHLLHKQVIVFKRVNFEVELSWQKMKFFILIKRVFKIK